MRWTVLLALCAAIPLTISTVSGVAVAQDRDQNVQSLLAEARMAQSRGDFSGAADAYQKAVALEPSIPELWANLGLMEHESGRISEAMTSFQNAARLKPSLFVPQLFLGLEYLQSNKAEAALPHLESAVRLNPGDLQAALTLGKANSVLERGDRAADSYLKATQIAPKDGNAWLGLGTAYLQAVESDAREMATTYSHSAHVKLRTAEALAEEGKLIQAEEAYETAISTESPVPCAHAEFGITFLRRKKVTEAREQFKLERQSGTHCGLAPLGVAVANLAEGLADASLEELTSIALADPGFIASSLPLFRGAVTSDQARSLINLAQTRTKDTALSIDMASLIEKAFLSEDPPDLSAPVISRDDGPDSTSRETAPRSAEQLYENGQYEACKEALEPVLHSAAIDQLQLLASCSFYAGDLRTTSIVAERLKANHASRVEGLYWETKADQWLAIRALVRAGEIDADSPQMHVLLGDVFREKRRLEEAEAEYRKAVALDPKGRSARLSLAITLFSQLKNDEAFNLDESILVESPADPEANLLAAEILVQRNQFSAAEPYLLKCANLKPELMPRYHALLGRVYAETNRTEAAIAEYKLGLSTDEDGSIHYQVARLYQKSGNKVAAAEAFKESKRLVDRRHDRARIALEQLDTDTSRQ